jgi:arylsulfatase A-like enzyme
MPERPNILLILADSAQQHVYGCCGGPARTPHADRLAVEGVRFRRAYCAAPICHPARSVIDTGLFPHANGMLTNRCGRGAYPFRVYDHLPSLAETLRGAGYRTGSAGQGHIDVRGFDEDRSYPTAQFHTWLRECGYEERALPDQRYRGCGRLEGDLEVARDTQFAVAAVQLIEEFAAGEGRPWFIQCDFDGPHPPCLVPPPYDTEYDPEQVALPPSLRDPLTDVPPAVRNARRAQGGERWSDEDWRRYIAHFYAMTTVIDLLVGRVLGALERCDAVDRTLVIFTSDHAGLMGSHGFVMHGAPALYDPVMCVPFIVRWPGATQAGTECHEFISHADVLPTLAEIAGAGQPAVHGRSLLPLLHGGPATDWRDDMYGQYNGDGVLFYSVRSLRTRAWSYTFAPHGGEELYDLRLDRHERWNRASDPAAMNGLREMRARLQRWMERIEDPLRLTGISRALLER